MKCYAAVLAHVIADVCLRQQVKPGVDQLHAMICHVPAIHLPCLLKVWWLSHFSRQHFYSISYILLLPTDNIWWSTGEHTPHSWRHHPHPDAPRCIPCHYDDSAHIAAAEATIPSFKAIKGCPCTPELLCAHNNHSDHMSEDWFNKYCDMPRLPYHMYSMHGGAGALMSIGLMRKVSWDFVEPCVLKTFSTGIATHVVYRLLFEHAPMSLSSVEGAKIFVHMDSPTSLLYTPKLVLFHVHSALFSLHSAQIMPPQLYCYLN